MKPDHPKTPVQQLFDLAIARVDVHDGMLLLNQHKLALDFSVNQVVAAMTYDRLAQRYDGSVQVGKMDAKYQDFRDVAAQADLQFSLWHNQAEIKALKFASEASSLEIAGKVTDFESPQVQLTYSSTIDVAQMGAVTRVYQLRGGTIALDGSGSYSDAAGYASTGRIAVRDFDYLDDDITLRKATLNSNFSLANNNLSMTRIAARLLGGMLTGDAEVKNLWPNQLTPIAPTPAEPIGLNGKPVARNTGKVHGTQAAVKSVSAYPEEGSARLRVNGLSLNELVHMASTKALPLDKLNAVGSVTGSVNVTWKHVLADAFADLALDIASPAQLSNASNQLPLSGQVNGRYGARSGSIELSALSLTTPHTHLDATGTLGATSAALKLNAQHQQPDGIPAHADGDGQCASADRTGRGCTLQRNAQWQAADVRRLPVTCKRQTSPTSTRRAPETPAPHTAARAGKAQIVVPSREPILRLRRRRNRLPSPDGSTSTSFPATCSIRNRK